MKTKEIIGANYIGSWTKKRTGCRSIIIEGENILLSYGARLDIWALPGGGLEDNESEIDCVIRETKEETGYIISTYECLLTIDEYYEDVKYVNNYFLGKIVGKTTQNLTELEKEELLEAHWIPFKKALEIFSKYNEYENVEEMKRGLYFREYIALTTILNID